jgi:PfaD family protein
MVIALGKAGFLGSFGSAGLVPPRIEAAIRRIQEALPEGPYAFNLIHSPSEDAMERNAVDLFLKYGVRTVEASAFLGLTPSIVYYRAAGLSLDPAGNIQVNNRVIAKLSRKEVATRFLEPAPQKILQQLVEERRITEQQANLAQHVPMADDITVEADSGGHTDNRPLVALVPTMLALRDEIQAKYGYAKSVRVGAAGGISHPASVLSAFMMGAAYVVTGTINQACVEAGASEHTRGLLSKAAMTEVIMAPAADMFEMGVRVQVLKAGTLFPMRASKLFELYNRYDSIDSIPVEEREKIEKQIFRRDLDSVWQECVLFFSERDPQQIERANNNPKRKMALIFRWYLGLSSRWSNNGEQGREMDYQIWCGPSIGPFNDWTRNTYLADPANRRVVDVALHLMTGAAFLYRVDHLKVQGLQVPAGFDMYTPAAPLV